MDEDDYRALIDELVRQLRDVGADDITDEAHYVVTNQETGEGEIMPPHDRLIEMLRAFERFLAVRDGKVAHDALERIQRELRAGSTSANVPNEAVIVLTAERDVTRAEVNLVEVPELTTVRSELNVLIEQLLPRDGSPPSARTSAQ